MTTRAVDRLLQLFLALALVPVLAGVGFGCYLIRQDAQQSGEFLDGIGVLAGLVVVAVAGVPGTLAVIALSRSWRNLPGQRTYALAAGALGAVATLLFAFFYAPAVAAMVPALLVVATAAVARSGSGDTFGA
ncbi:hypothetical protein BH10ACT10_BH10ACT10_19300 [soil metagenome]